MKPARRFILIVLACGLISSVKTCEAIDIAVTGNWSLTIDAGDLTCGAGSDLTSTYDSASDQVTVTISNTTGVDDNWRVDVKRTDTTWHDDFTLSLKRKGDGTGGGSISGGTAYQAVGTSDSAFFSGAGDRSEVVRRMTNHRGEFVFDGVRPGKWHLKIYDDNLPPYHYLETTEMEVELKPAGSEQISINVLPRLRRIRMIDEGGTETNGNGPKQSPTVEPDKSPTDAPAAGSKEDKQ